MDGGSTPFAVMLDREFLNRLMPMHLAVSTDGAVLSAGSTMAKILPGKSLLGQKFFDLFELRRPTQIQTVEQLAYYSGRRLHLHPRGQPQDGLRGTAVLLAAAGGAGETGVLLNLTFGVGIIDGVRRHRLTDADFAASDLTMELLYLVEAKSAVMQELRGLNLRLEDAKAAAEAQALTDPLTGLSNRRGADLRLNGHSANRVGFALMHMDLDFFKRVNDSYGHAAGDHVLQTVAGILRAHTRTEDCSARIGGDEFIVILPGLTGAEDLRSLALRIIDAVSRPIRFNGAECHVSVSIGIAIHKGDKVANLEGLSRSADEALYAAKHAGRRQVSFAPTD
jgi:diguanylate cyclase (GGDEF)-like protein